MRTKINEFFSNVKYLENKKGTRYAICIGQDDVCYFFFVMVKSNHSILLSKCTSGSLENIINHSDWIVVKPELIHADDMKDLLELTEKNIHTLISNSHFLLKMVNGERLGILGKSSDKGEDVL